MKDNRPEDGTWQTKVLELNLMVTNQREISRNIFSLLGRPISRGGHPQHGDLEPIQQTKDRRPVITYLHLKYMSYILLSCEQKNLLQRALENYGDLKDISRVCLRA